MNRILAITSCALFCFFKLTAGISQVFTPIHPDSSKPTDPLWETGYQSRVDEMLNAFKFTTCGSGSSGVDVGKNLWPSLFSQMYKKRNNPVTLDSLINTCGNSLINSQWAGSMCGPFSGPGISNYYFQFKDRLPQAQKVKVRNYLYQPTNYPYRCPSGLLGWHFFMRSDQQMDPVYNSENPETNPANQYNGNEKDSENYHWMQRMPGALFAEEFCDSNNVEDAQRLSFFRTWSRNWIRALYNVGRIEWNSVSYWGHTIQPLQVFHNHVKNPEVRKMAKAGLDWMLLELALHYVDGFQAGADVRAKEGAYKPFAGSSWGYAWYYFADQNHLPSYYSPGIFNTKTTIDFIGYSPFSSYRPSQVLIDIAQRKFPMPVEIQSAKPFYALDHESYKDWKGNTFKSRRFEFETLWLDSNFLLSSLASNIPDGWAECDRQRPFAEQSMWRLSVKGTNNGAVQIYGNSGSLLAGKKRHVIREPREQIGQFRNAMMRILRNPDSMWIELPRIQPVSKENNRVFIDFGNAVYAAFQPYGAIALDTMTVPQDMRQIRYLWTFNPNSKLGALVLETGTGQDFSSYSNFKNQVMSQSAFSATDTNTIVYNSASGHSLKMEYQHQNQPYTMITPVVPPCSVPNAGTVAKVWGDGQYINFERWESYKVVHGKQIVYQPWGGGFLDLRSANNGLQIRVDSSNGSVSYYGFDPNEYTTQLNPSKRESNRNFRIIPNPLKEGEWVKLEGDYAAASTISILDLTGHLVFKNKITGNSGNRSIQLPISGIPKGIYLVKVEGDGKQETLKLVVE